MLAFLFTDIAGSTTLWEQHTEVMERALARRDAIMRQAIDAYGGQVFNTAGHAFYAVFTLPPTRSPPCWQRSALWAESWGSLAPLRIRTALHVGAAHQRDGDYYGPPLNRIARLCAAGHGGQVLLSNAAQELVRDALPRVRRYATSASTGSKTWRAPSASSRWSCRICLPISHRCARSTATPTTSRPSRRP
jgi:class 3 adenylate cyclase